MKLRTIERNIDLFKHVLSFLDVKSNIRSRVVSKNWGKCLKTKVACENLEIVINNVKDIHLVCNIPRIIVKDSSFDNSYISYVEHACSLDLVGTSVKDVSNLGNVHTLNLAYTDVTNVSNLGNVHTLNLKGTYVTNVSNLGNVHTLNLKDTKVTDFSNLGNVHILHKSVV